MVKIALMVLALLVFSEAAPLQASGGAGTVPEPSDLALFALGVIGVIIGRQSIARGKDHRPED